MFFYVRNQDETETDLYIATLRLESLNISCERVSVEHHILSCVKVSQMENLFVLISDSSRFNNNSLTELNCTISGKCKEVIDNLQINILYVFMEAMVAFFAVFGNAIVIAAFVSERKLRKRTNYYIVSLALADFLVGFVGIPIAIMVKANSLNRLILSKLIYSQISMGLPRNCQMCLMMMSLLLSFCTISIYSLLLISVDRFIVSTFAFLSILVNQRLQFQSILMPLKYPAIQNWATFEIALCWSIGCVIGFLPFAWHEPLPISRCFYHDVVTEGYQMFRFVFVILVPACTVFLIYWMIYREVLHQVSK